MSENLHRGEESANPVAWRRWGRVVPAIAALLLLAAGVGVVLMEYASSGTPQKSVSELVAELEHPYSEDWFSNLLRKVFPDYGKVRDSSEVVGDLSALGAEAVPEIITAAGHNLPSVRMAAAEALGLIGDRRAVTPLAGLLARDSDSLVRQVAAITLGQLGGLEATAHLIEAMTDADSDVRRLVASALGNIGGPEATARLIEVMADSNPMVRETAAQWLGNIGDTVAADVLMRVLDDKDDPVRPTAARSIGEIGEHQYLPRLIELLKDPAENIRIAAAGGLGELGDPAAVAPLLGAITDTEGEVRVSAAWALGDIGDLRAMPALLAALTDANERVRAAAARSLGLLHDPRAVDALVFALNDKDDEVRANSAFALALQKRPEAVPILTETLMKGRTWSAVNAVVDLTLIDTPDARQALAAGARKAVSPAVRRLAARAQTMPVIEAMTEELRGKDRTLQCDIVSVFADLRDPASLPALEEALKNPDLHVRYAARCAIRQVRRANQPQPASAPTRK